MSNKGTVQIDFGTGAVSTSVFESDALIQSTDLVESWVRPSTTSNNTVDNHWVEDIEVIAGEAIQGSGFTVYAKCKTLLAHGIYNIGWVYA